jgi:toxin-antitoxin system PIN domain toxin
VILLDTNVLVYSANAEAPQHQASRAVVEAALDQRIVAVLVPQVLLEFLAVITNPRRVARPLDAEQAWEQVSLLSSHLPVLDLRRSALSAVGDLMISSGRTGRPVFDLFLAAQLRSHEVATLCTYNTSDFAGLLEIDARRPEEVLADR